MDYDDLIEREKQRRLLLVQKLDETDRRLQALMSASRQPDPLDKWLDEQMAKTTRVLITEPTSAPMPSIVSDAAGANDAVAKAPRAAKMTRETPRKISPQWVGLIAHLGFDGKDFSQVEQFMARSGTPMTPGAIRTGLMNYRKDYGLVSNPKPGFYAATQKGMDFVKSLGATSDDGLTVRKDFFDSEPKP